MNKDKEKLQALYRELLGGLILQETLEKEETLEKDFIPPSKKPTNPTPTEKQSK